METSIQQLSTIFSESLVLVELLICGIAIVRVRRDARYAIHVTLNAVRRTVRSRPCRNVVLVLLTTSLTP